MRKIIVYLLLSYGTTTTGFAQSIDSTTFYLDKTEITTNVLYPSLENDTTASWLKFG